MIPFDRKKHFLALDFDGVIADSIAECLVVGHNAFARFSGSGKAIQSLAELDQEQLRDARRVRNFIRSGEDYVFIFLALSEGVQIQTQEAFDAFTTFHSDLTEEFLQFFYEVRIKLSTENPGTWAALNPLYPGMGEFLNAYTQKDNLFIITTKKGEFVKSILDVNQVVFNSAHLFHANEVRPKRMILEILSKEKGVELSRFFFVDDQVDTLLKVQSSGVQCILAGWGYNNPEQAARAEAARIPVLALADFLRSF
jgi:phosphoglycolate phosphatase-like HAD superfamily hydrolase